MKARAREYVLLLNEKGEFIGTGEKYDVHPPPPPGFFLLALQ